MLWAGLSPGLDFSQIRLNLKMCLTIQHTISSEVTPQSYMHSVNICSSALAITLCRSIGLHYLLV